MKRLRSVLLTLWDLARENPDYDRKLWGELQFLLSDLETRNKILCTLMSDMLRIAEALPETMLDQSLIHSPPEGYAMEFLRKELAQEAIPMTMKSDGTPKSLNVVDLLMDISPPPPIPTKKSAAGKRLSDDLNALEPSPQVVQERYDGGDESLEDSSDELVFDFGTTD